MSAAPRVSGVRLSPGGVVTYLLEDAPPICSPLGVQVPVRSVDVTRGEDPADTVVRVCSLVTFPLVRFVTLEFRADGRWPQRLQDCPAWLLDLVEVPLADGLAAGCRDEHEDVPAPIGCRSVTARPFSGVEWRVDVTGAPALTDMLPPYRTFIAEAVLVAHYGTGHWVDPDVPYTQVTVVGGIVGSERTPGRAEWMTGGSVSGPVDRGLASMPGWLHAFVLAHTGLDLRVGEPQPNGRT